MSEKLDTRGDVLAFVCANKDTLDVAERARLAILHATLPADAIWQTRAERRSHLEKVLQKRWDKIRGDSGTPEVNRGRMARIIAGILGNDDDSHQRVVLDLYREFSFRPVNRAAICVVCSGVPEELRFSRLRARVEIAQVESTNDA